MTKDQNFNSDVVLDEFVTTPYKYGFKTIIETEKFPKGMVKDWIVRSERETLCKFSNNHSLFAINVRFQKLSSILKYQEAIEGLKRSLENMDQEEINYFGGNRKVDKIFRFITSY